MTTGVSNRHFHHLRADAPLPDGFIEVVLPGFNYKLLATGLSSVSVTSAGLIKGAAARLVR